MTTENKAKLQNLLALHRPGTVSIASWLDQHGISHDLQKHYRKSGWLESVGTGAFKRPGDTVEWQGGVYALQAQAGLPVHVGGLTALALQGYAHYLRLGQETLFLYSPQRVNLPAWFKGHDWGRSVHHCKTSILPPDLALTDYSSGSFSIRISAPERSILECLHLVPNAIDLVECYQVMQGLLTLRPKVLHELLTHCTSIKVKRLFLYMAYKAGHPWAERLKADDYDLGSGTRTITKGGVHVAAFGLILPEELVQL